jgi:serine/threonine protein kinase
MQQKLLLPVDRRVDIYSLGCTAYWLLTGTLVFDEPELNRLMEAHLHVVPPPLSERTDAEIPPALARLRCKLGSGDDADRRFVRVLAAAGMGVGDLVKITAFIVPADGVGLFRAIRDRRLLGHAPACTYLQVAGLASPAFLFELEGEAARETGP